jgi:ferredoxin
VVVVNCAEAGGTCFCTSMGTGPRAEGGFDIALTEVLADDGDGEHHFVVEAASEAGRALVDRLPTRPATDAELAQVDQICRETAASMGRVLETDGIREMLQDNPEHPRWDDVAQRCLTCTNCTLVCPTCFCTSVEDSTDLTGKVAKREQRWDSCFTLDFSYLHGGSVRKTNKGRYRQWMTHKLSTWYDQFGSSGCVGCGRCITWCPVGIDITEEAAAIRASTDKDYTSPNTRPEAGR